MVEKELPQESSEISALVITTLVNQPKLWRQLREDLVLMVFGYQQLSITLSSAN